jgi:hypothetical protein
VKTGICGYHSSASPGGVGPVPYVVQPWVAGNAGGEILSYSPLTTNPPTPDVLACQDNRSLQEPNQLTGLNPFGNYAEGLADVIINDLSIEQRSVTVNPFLTGWYQTATNAEQGDVCQFNLGPPPPEPPKPNKETQAASLSNETINGHNYYLSWAFDSADVTAGRGFGCWSGVSLEPFFTAPSPVNPGDIVGFNGSESDITLDARTTGLPADEPYVATVYTWNFGDGSPEVSGAAYASVFHSYAHGGKYSVTLTVTDSGGNTNHSVREITVVLNPGEVPTGGSAPGSTGTGSGTVGAGGSGSKSPGAAAKSVPAPVAAALIVTHSLRRALHKGLVIRYSVNEQVAGRFEVLLSRATARRLGIGGSPAVGLPVGTPPQLIIGRAFLVTTSAGRSTVNIQFSKRTASRLARLHSVSLMLRLSVRNAASHSPATTTVLSTVTLSH